MHSNQNEERLPTKVHSEPDSCQLEIYPVPTLYSTAVKVNEEASELRIYKMLFYCVPITSSSSSSQVPGTLSSRNFKFPEFQIT